MGFDFKDVEKQAKKFRSSGAMEAICLAPGGAGKSYLAGTMDGKILYLHTQGERHGPQSAETKCKGEIIPISIDTYNNPNKDPDLTIKTTLDILTDIDGIKKAGFTGVVIDSMTEYESLIQRTKKYKMFCMTTKGEHNNFKEGPAVIDQFRDLLNALRALADEGIHYYVTCALDVKDKDEDGSVLEATPQLSGYRVIETLVLQFPDVFIVGEMENAEGKRAHRIQFGATVSKESKDQNGNIKRYLNFTPRLTGVDPMPSTLKADLKEVIKLVSVARGEKK